MRVGKDAFQQVRVRHGIVTAFGKELHSSILKIAGQTTLEINRGNCPAELLKAQPSELPKAQPLARNCIAVY